MPAKIHYDPAELQALVESGMRSREMADHFGVEKSTIERWKRKHGLKCPFGTGPRPGQISGDKHPAWSGGIVRHKGYELMYAPDHPNTTKRGYVYTHRLIMELIVGRTLKPREVIHHIDGCRGNNSPENLLLFPSNGGHMWYELLGRTPGGPRGENTWTPRESDDALTRKMPPWSFLQKSKETDRACEMGPQPKPEQLPGHPMPKHEMLARVRKGSQ